MFWSAIWRLIFHLTNKNPFFSFCWNWNWRKKTIIFLSFIRYFFDYWSGIFLLFFVPGWNSLVSIFLVFFKNKKIYQNFCFFLGKNSRIKWEKGRIFVAFHALFRSSWFWKIFQEKKINFFPKKFHRVHYHHHMAFNLVVLTITNECSVCSWMSHILLDNRTKQNRECLCFQFS